MASSEHSHGPAPFRRLVQLVRTERADLSSIVVYSIAIGVLSLAAPVAVQALVNTVAFGTVLQPLVVLTVLLAVALAASAVLQCMRLFAVEVIQRRVFVRLSSQVSDVLLRVQAAAFDRWHGPELVNRFLDVVTVQKSFAILLIDGLTLMMQTVIGLLLLALYHPYLLAFDALLVALMFLILFVGGRGAVRTAIAESQRKYDVLAWLEEMARNQQSVRSGPGTRFAIDRANHLVTSWLDTRGAHFRILLRQLAGALTLQAVAVASLLGVGGWLVVNGELTLGQLVAAELVVSVVVSSFAKFGKSLESCYDLLAALDKLGYLTDLPLEKGVERALSARPGPGRIVWHDVSFAHDPSRPLITGAKVDIAAGSRVAVYGRGGHGKSTVLELMGGLRAADAGSAEFNGVDFRDYSLAGIRNQVAFVRSVEVFPGTLLENVALGGEHDIAEVRAALAAAGLEEVVLALPDGINTVLGTRGQPLSRSQALRLMLSRAILRSPAVLIVDEVLDQLDDFDPHGSLARTLFGPDRPWTLILATEDHEIASQCDRILSLTNGRLIERLPAEIKMLAVHGGAA